MVKEYLARGECQGMLPPLRTSHHTDVLYELEMWPAWGRYVVEHFCMGHVNSNSLFVLCVCRVLEHLPLCHFRPINRRSIMGDLVII